MTTSRTRNTNTATVFLMGFVALFICVLALIVFDAIGDQDDVATIASELHETHDITVTEVQAHKLASGRETEVVDADGELILIRVTDHANIGNHPTFELTKLLGE